MATTYYISPAGSDSNSGTAESQAWKTLETSSRLKPGDILVGLPGTLTGTFRPPSGTAAAPITFRAKEAGTATVDGSRRIDGLGWTRITNGYQTPFAQLAFNVFQRTFETDGKRANFNNRDFNQYSSNPQLDLHGTPAEFKWQNGSLRLNAIPSTPSAEPLYAATTEVALDLNGRSHVVVEGIVTRGHKHAVATNGGTSIHLSGCRFTFCGSTAVWLVKLADASMIGCVIQGAGSWEGHYEDLVHVSEVSNLRIVDCNLSYGGHSGVIMLDGVPGKITLVRNHFHHMGGSLLTLKRNVDNLLVEDCWFADAAKSTAVDAHKVPHAGIQLSGRGHVFRNSVFIDNGKDILASSDGNPDSNPVCQDILFDRCTFSGSEAGAVEGQEYAPNGRMERMTWRDCIIKGDVALFYGGVGDRTSNRLEHCQVVGSTNRGVIAQNCSSGPLPNTGSTLTAPPSPGAPIPPIDPPVDPEEPPVPPTPGQPVLTALTPSTGKVGDRITATGQEFGPGCAFIVSVTVKPETPQGLRRILVNNQTDVLASYIVPSDAVSGDVFVRNMQTQKASNKLPFTLSTGPTPPPVNQPPVAHAGGPYTGIVGQAVQFDGSRSTDADGTIANWRWNFGDGVIVSMNVAGYPKIYAAPGTYTVSLIVTDNQGAIGTATTTATITAAPPPVEPLKVTITATPTPTGGSFSGVVIDSEPLAPGSTVTVQVELPDGDDASATVTIPGTPTPPADTDRERALAILSLTNAERARAGVLPLEMADVEEVEAVTDAEGRQTSSTRNEEAGIVLAEGETRTLGALTENAALRTAAEKHAKDMAERNYFSHTNPDGKSPFDRMREAGYTGQMMGENIAQGYPTAEAVMTAWLNSPGHRANILHPGYRVLGVGCYQGRDVQCFGG